MLVKEKVFAHVVKDLDMGDLGLSWWAQCNRKDPYKREEGGLESVVDVRAKQRLE